MDAISLDANGWRFDALSAGPADGALALLLHGFPQTAHSWRRVLPELARAGYRVVAPNLRGVSPGARPADPGAYATAPLVADVLAIAGALGEQRFHLVGHDWGGVLAWSLGTGHPERLGTLTSLATPHPSALARSLLSSTQFLRSWYVLFYQLPLLPEFSETTDRGARLFRQALVRSGLGPERADRYVEVLRSGAAGPAINWYRALPFAPRSAFGKVVVPTLYVYPGADFALGRRAADLTADFVTGDYRYEVVEGAGHWLPEESADQVTPTILDFLQSHPLR